MKHSLAGTRNERGFRRGWWEGALPALPTAHAWQFEDAEDLVVSLCGGAVRRVKFGPLPVDDRCSCRPCMACLRVGPDGVRLAVWK